LRLSKSYKTKNNTFLREWEIRAIVAEAVSSASIEK